MKILFLSFKPFLRSFKKGNWKKIKKVFIKEDIINLMMMMMMMMMIIGKKNLFRIYFLSFKPFLRYFKKGNWKKIKKVFIKDIINLMMIMMMMMIIGKNKFI